MSITCVSGSDQCGPLESLLWALRARCNSEVERQLTYLTGLVAVHLRRYRGSSTHIDDIIQDVVAEFLEKGGNWRPEAKWGYRLEPLLHHVVKCVVLRRLAKMSTSVKLEARRAAWEIRRKEVDSPWIAVEVQEEAALLREWMSSGSERSFASLRGITEIGGDGNLYVVRHRAIKWMKRIAASE